METKILYKGVKFANEPKIDMFVSIGVPPRGYENGELETLFGENTIIRSHCVIYAGNVIGRDFQCGHHVMIRESNTIGDHVSIGTGTVIEHHVTLENNIRIHSQAFIPEYSLLKEGCWIGPNVVLTNARYPNRSDTKNNLQGITVGKKAVIGANCTILPGLVIGEKSVIGAGSVVVRDVPPNTICAGNPARIFREVDYYNIKL